MIMSKLIINTYVSLMYELKKNGKVFASKFVGTGSSSYEKRIYPRSHKGRETAVEYSQSSWEATPCSQHATQYIELHQYSL